MTGAPLRLETAALLSAHALGVLRPEEAEEAERLIAESEACRHVFGEALDTAARLALAVTTVAPRPRLRERILEAVRSEAAAG